MSLRIVYVARFGNTQSNDDEGAITHALRALGHEVVEVPEREGDRAAGIGGDFLLFNHWADPETLSRVRIPCVFWYFDQVECADPSLKARSQVRRRWMKEMLPLVKIGFCTDGDWVEKVNRDDPEKPLVRLSQGFDERLSPHAPKTPLDQDVDLLLLARYERCGLARQRFINEMKRRYQHLNLVHLPSGCYREDLAHTVARSKIILAPEGPVSDRYWSNRVYLISGLEGFLLHPFSQELAEHYKPDHEIKFYHDCEDLFHLIEVYLREKKVGHRAWQAAAAREQTLREHTYRHRVEKMIEVLRERGVVS